jgi:hypothetical protein
MPPPRRLIDQNGLMTNGVRLVLVRDEGGCGSAMYLWYLSIEII